MQQALHSDHAEALRTACRLNQQLLKPQQFSAASSRRHVTYTVVDQASQDALGHNGHVGQWASSLDRNASELQNPSRQLN